MSIERKYLKSLFELSNDQIQRQIDDDDQQQL